MFDVIISVRAYKEIENAVEYYALYSAKAPLYFTEMLEKAFKELNHNPFHAVRYKNVRAIKIRKFPYNLFYITDENKKIVRVLACFHNKRNPRNRPNV